MSNTAKKIELQEATYEDLCKVEEHLVAEIIDGELITSPRPAGRHAFASSVLGVDLGGCFGRGNGGPPHQPGGWWIIDEPELHLAGQILVPDLAGWRRERMPQFPDVTFFTLVPDFICEVLSPHTARIDRTQKMSIYAENKVPFLWLVDPTLHMLEVYQLEPNGWHLAQTFAGSIKVRAVPFDAVELEMRDWWIDPE